MLWLLLTAFTIVGPDGWAPAPRETLALDVPAGFVTKTYRSQDLEGVFLAARPADDQPVDVATVSSLADRYVEQFRNVGATVTRDHRLDEGRTIDDLAIEMRTGEHYRVRIAHGKVGRRYEVIFGACRGRGEVLAACATTLAQLNVEIDPRVDYSPVKRAIQIISTCLVLLALAIWGLRGLLRRRNLKRSAPLVEGEIVTVTGTVRPLAPMLEAPLSGHACVLHRSRARVVDARGVVLGEPTESAAVPFVLDTPRGSITIDERQPAITCAADRIADVDAARVRAFRARNLPDSNASAMFDEVVIKPGATISVRGVVTLERELDSATERGYRDDVPVRTCLISAAQQPLQILDVW